MLQLIINKDMLTRNNQMSQKQINELNANCTQFLTINEALNKDLQMASKTIVSFLFTFSLNTFFYLIIMFLFTG